MIDLDDLAPCGWCGGRIEWTHRPNDPMLYDGCCVSCGALLPAYEAPWTWRDLPSGYHLRALIAEVERLRAELAAATAKGAAEEREAVLEFLREPLDALRERATESPYHQGARDGFCSAIDRIERGAHREESR